MVTITFCNQKGGVSKTTSAAETASILASRGNRVLVVDMDPQGNLSDIFGVTTDGRDTMYELLKGEASFDDVCVLRGGVAVLPSEITLAMLEPKLAGASLGREQRLAKILRKYSNEYDFTVIDCPPASSPCCPPCRSSPPTSSSSP